MWYMAQDRTAWWNKFSFPATRPIYSSGLDTRWYDVEQSGHPPCGRTLRTSHGQLIRRLLLVIPTLWAIITITFYCPDRARRPGRSGHRRHRV